MQILQLNRETNSPKIAIIGAGASGLCVSIFLNQQNITTTIYEKNNKIGKKLLATGNGKCNITNKNISIENYHSSFNGTKDLKKIFNIFNFESCKKFFSQMGIEFLYKDNGRAYPMSSSSSSIVEALKFELEQQSKTTLLLNTAVESIEYHNNKFIINNTDQFDMVILATGSGAMPKLGGTNSGYMLAKQFNHTLIPPQPSLVQLITSNKNLEMISGVKLTGSVKNHTGDILFTKYGLSGSAILDISREIAIELQYTNQVQITIDLLPELPKEKLKSLLQQRVKKLPNKKIPLWLDGIFNKKLSQYIMAEVKLPTKIHYPNQLGTKEINKIVHFIKNTPFTIIGTKGFEHCEVCSGGVDLNEIDLNTMESKKQKGLYIIGEILDIDGDCGGYNLHWAWASAFVTAKGVSRFFK